MLRIVQGCYSIDNKMFLTRQKFYVKEPEDVEGVKNKRLAREKSDWWKAFSNTPMAPGHHHRIHGHQIEKVGGLENE